ncbi:hypothetical protein TRFO_06720 [Tritrichomonas foetus]|uniref:SET domain-containing protein n=1 Tax=Tritrichomonas foetus TaxID=1144522 RepID=A0A1J4JYC0_9EUKA|nr:hypothetical protein TRFO_06720 [Tritrichomonas foetus]|eukprot:OHT03464.1 hypothetical protein TRFO_06720 [Tritrichomonas foetus]
MHDYVEVDDDSQSDILSDDDQCDMPVDIFVDPFLEIEPYLLQDNSINQNPGFYDLIFFLKSAWLDPYFYRNRVVCCLIPDDYFPEEKGLLILIYELLKLPANEPLDHFLLTVFCMITGRCPELLAFDPLTRINAHTVNFKAPLYLNSSPGEGPCCIVPYLILIAIHKTVPFPSVQCFLEEFKNGVIQKSVCTTNQDLIFGYAKRSPPEMFPLSFEAGITLTSYVTRYPTSDGNFWIRVKCGPFAVAFGNDVSNGRGKIKYPWENRYNGNPPPTLSEDGINTEILWIDEPEMRNAEDVVRELSKTSNLGDFCQVHNPLHYKEAFEAHIYDYDEEVKDKLVILSANPKTGRLHEADLHHLQKSDNLLVMECNEFCPCKRNCLCCFTNRMCEDLMMFYSPDKDWGVVATKDIEPGSLITTYAGEFRDDNENRNTADQNSNANKDLNENNNGNSMHDEDDNLYYFALEYDDYTTNKGYHALKKCNIGRFINQSHATQDSQFSQPNAGALNVVSHYLMFGIIAIFSQRKIYRGEEITLTYGEYYQMERSCACNTCLLKQNSLKNVLSFIENPQLHKTKSKEKNHKGRKRRHEE